jgi:hypothetical protein
MRKKIKLTLIAGLLMTIFNFCSGSYTVYDVSIDEVTGVIKAEPMPNDSTSIGWWK